MSEVDKYSYEAWKTFGQQIKTIQKELMSSIAANHTLVTMKELDKINKAVKYIDLFRNVAEDRMFKTVKPDSDADNWKSVW